MSTESDRLQWKSEGLPADELSIENAIMILSRHGAMPFIIDPSCQVAPWLAVHLRKPLPAPPGQQTGNVVVPQSRPVEVISHHDPRFLNALELAIRFGKTLIVQVWIWVVPSTTPQSPFAIPATHVQEVDRIDPVLYPVLRRDLVKEGPRLAVLLGEKLVDYHEDFRVFLLTRNPDPQLPPDAASIVAEVNFSVTRAGLEGQLLSLTIQNEKPTLEKQKSELLQREEALKIDLAALERNLLLQLASTTGNILENKELVASLNETKAKSQTITASLAESAALQRDLDQQRDVYRPYAATARGDAIQNSTSTGPTPPPSMRAMNHTDDTPTVKVLQGVRTYPLPLPPPSDLTFPQQAAHYSSCFSGTMFFVLQSMRAMNHMYQFVLAPFLVLFRRALANAPRPAAVADRLAALTALLQTLVLQYGARSLFKADRLTYALHFVHGLRPDMFGEGEWDVFTGRSERPPVGVEQVPRWVAVERQAACARLLGALPDLDSSAQLSDAELWAQWSSHAQCETQFPSRIAARISAFRCVLLVQALRPDRTLSALHRFVTEALQALRCWLGRMDGVFWKLHQNARNQAMFLTKEPASLNLKNLVSEETGPAVPVLLITTPGTDPTRDLEELATRVVGPARYRQIAMGQGQAGAATAAIEQAMARGEWVCLKNLHLVTPWLPELEKRISQAASATGGAEAAGEADATVGQMQGGTPVHPDFRLFLTTEPHDHFSTILLQQCLKITYEAPPEDITLAAFSDFKEVGKGVSRPKCDPSRKERHQEEPSSAATTRLGIKKNLQRSYETWSDEFIASGSPLRARMLFVVAWLHAILQERRTYIPQAWTKFYEFGSSDLRSAADIVEDLHQTACQVYFRPHFFTASHRISDIARVASAAAQSSDAPRPSVSASGPGAARTPGLLPWDALHGLLGSAVYGGRIDAAPDARVLETYLRMWFSDGEGAAISDARVLDAYLRMWFLDVPPATNQKSAKSTACSIYLGAVPPATNQKSAKSTACSIYLGAVPPATNQKSAKSTACSIYLGAVPPATNQKCDELIKQSTPIPFVLPRRRLFKQSTHHPHSIRRLLFSHPTVLPVTNQKCDYVDTISNLPDMDHPSFFGLPANIEGAVQTTEGTRIIGDLKALLQDQAAGDLPPTHPDKSILTLPEICKHAAAPILSPIDAFVLLEARHAHALLERVEDGLSALEKVLEGAALLTPQTAWSSLWDGPDSCHAWLRGAVRRTVAITHWVDALKLGNLKAATEATRGYINLLRDPIDLADLFRPETFLNAVRQQTARKCLLGVQYAPLFYDYIFGLAVDGKAPLLGLKIATCWDSSWSTRLNEDPRSDKVIVHLKAMFVQGSRWNGKAWVAAQANSPITGLAPDFCLAWIKLDQSPPHPANTTAPVPIYHSDQRERLLMEVQMPCEDNAAGILSGMALFLQSA
ncbi:putative Cytoplasmic dynein 2 heavy chain 1 [Paratrimastix pyriformis]|uniref:Cytoplasmic dynein 2 heavy chain 1 n=1 Tax=Paratrimastix pyriformis TaxID=342808 RepID=A0ABQ8UF30_9EUKA|nr:putative Cytoplasmic dynein 2 heavy chain 1 [Paratrimastix pyriformis]